MKINEKTRMILNIAASAALCAVVGVTALFGMFFSKNHIRSAEISAETETTDDGTGAVISDTTSNGIQLLSTQITPNDDGTGSCTITASISPSNLSDKTVTMSVAWADPESDWAADKTVTDYVTVTQTSAGSLTATLDCLQAFGEQVILTVTSNLDSSYYAESTIDYVKRVTNAYVSWSKQSGDIYVGDTFNANLMLILGTGTVTGEVSYCALSYRIDNTNSESDYNTAMICSAVSSAVSNGTYSIILYNQTNGSITIDLSQSLTSTTASTIFYSKSMTISDMSVFIKSNNSGDEAVEWFTNLCTSYGSINIDVVGIYTYSYNGIEYSVGTCSKIVTLYTSTDEVESVSIDDDSYIF